MPTETPPSDLAAHREREEQARKDEAAAAAAANGNGGAVEHQGGGEDDGPEPITLAIEGEGQLTLTVGGSKPDTSTVRLVGGKMDIASGDFDKGAHVNILIKGVVSAVEFIDSRDQYGNISGTERRHKIRPLGVERIYD